MVDLAAIDALDFLLEHTFYVPTEFEDLLDSGALRRRVAGNGQREAEAALIESRLLAFRPQCSSLPEVDAISLLREYVRLNALKLDMGENQLVIHLLFHQEGALVTADMRAIERLKISDAGLVKPFHQRCICFEELVWHLLKWKPYEDLKAGLYAGAWRRSSLAYAFGSNELETKESEFRAKVGVRAKQRAAELSPFLQCSWP